MMLVRDFLICLKPGDKVFITPNFRKPFEKDFAFTNSITLDGSVVNLVCIPDEYANAVIDSVRFNGYYVTIYVEELANND